MHIEKNQSTICVYTLLLCLFGIGIILVGSKMKTMPVFQNQMIFCIIIAQKVNILMVNSKHFKTGIFCMFSTIKNFDILTWRPLSVQYFCQPGWYRTCSRYLYAPSCKKDSGNSINCKTVLVGQKTHFLLCQNIQGTDTCCEHQKHTIDLAQASAKEQIEIPFNFIVNCLRWASFLCPGNIWQSLELWFCPVVN